MRKIVQASLMTTLGFLLTGASASAASVYSTTLSGANEVPANSSAGTGSATVTLSGNMLSVSVAFSGLGTTEVAAHIHCCGPLGMNESVALPFAAFPTGVTSAMYTHMFDLTDSTVYLPAFLTANGGMASSAETALVNGLNSNQTYVNIHTTAIPSGEIRGQLGAVPEPASVFLAGTALAALAAMKRKRLPS